MVYISQLITFSLAVFGVLFKSIKTDEDGKTIHDRSGMPSLTRTGKIVLSLIVVSNLISVYSTYQQAKSDEKKRQNAEKAQLESQTKLGNVEAQNKTLNDLLNQIYGLSNTISEEQKNRFQDMLTKQEKSGEQIANKIGASADSLDRKLGTSINRAANPIRDVLVSFGAILPTMKNADSDKYRERVRNGVLKFLGNKREYVDPADGIEVAGYDITSGSVQSVLINQGSSLAPQPVTEAESFLKLNCVGLDVTIYRKPVSSEQFQNGRTPRRDLWFPVSACVDMHNAKYDWALPYLRIHYWIDDESFSVRAMQMPVNQGNWDRDNDEIISVPDLRGAQLEIIPRENDVELYSFDIKMSGGLSFQCGPSDFKVFRSRYSTSYVCNLPG